MWLTLQQDKPDDFVFATGITTSLRELCAKAFKLVDIDLQFVGKDVEEKAFDKKTGKLIIDIDPRFSRKLEKLNPVGDFSKAKQILGWQPSFTIDDIVKEMIARDLLEEKI